MCGRYTLTEPLPFVEEHFQLKGIAAPVAEAYRPRYNIAPGQMVPAAVADEHGRSLTWFRWGLIPSWAKDPAIGYRMINARSETVAQKPSFRRAYRLRRCLLPADGFYEWRAEGRRKLPVRFRLTSGKLFALAGLWEEWSPPSGGEPIRSCTILTTTANDVVAPIHDRMPVMLSPDAYGAWLDLGTSPDTLRRLLRPYPPEQMEAYPVSTEVNSARNDYPALIEPTQDAASPIRQD